MTITQKDLEDFRSLVADNSKHTELECQKYLHFATDFLIGGTPISEIQIDLENRNFWGRSDFITGAILVTDTEREERFISVWELKAPQIPIMERDDNNNRYRPTKELIKAENQLLHYAYDAERNGLLLERFEISKRANVKIGGIIMGRSDRWLAEGAAPDAVQLAKNSFDVRVAYFYRSFGIRLVTWDKIIAHVSPVAVKQQDGGTVTS